MPSKKSGPQSPFVEDDADEVSLSPGDVYITRHSNLGGAHIVFHLVAGSDEEQLSRKELTSRHQVNIWYRHDMTGCLFVSCLIKLWESSYELCASISELAFLGSREQGVFTDIKAVSEMLADLIHWDISVPYTCTLTNERGALFAWCCILF